MLALSSPPRWSCTQCLSIGIRNGSMAHPSTEAEQSTTTQLKEALARPPLIGTVRVEGHMLNEVGKASLSLTTHDPANQGVNQSNHRVCTSQHSDKLAVFFSWDC